MQGFKMWCKKCFMTIRIVHPYIPRNCLYKFWIVILLVECPYILSIVTLGRLSIYTNAAKNTKPMFIYKHTYECICNCFLESCLGEYYSKYNRFDVFVQALLVILIKVFVRLLSCFGKIKTIIIESPMFYICVRCMEDIWGFP